MYCGRVSFLSLRLRQSDCLRKIKINVGWTAQHGDGGQRGLPHREVRIARSDRSQVQETALRPEDAFRLLFRSEHGCSAPFFNYLEVESRGATSARHPL